MRGNGNGNGSTNKGRAASVAVKKVPSAHTMDFKSREGWLTKSGKDGAHFKKRWCRLQGASITYYTSKTNFEKGRKPKGTIELTSRTKLFMAQVQVQVQVQVEVQVQVQVQVEVEVQVEVQVQVEVEVRYCTRS
jgi:hypothetical protein